MKSFFKWLINSFRRQPTVQLPRVTPVTYGHGHSECCVRPVVFAGPRFFIHFLTTGNADKLASIANRVGVELADELRQKEFGTDPLRFFFKNHSDALENWRNQPVIDAVRSILRNMNLRTEHDGYLASSVYGMPALMYRCVLLNDVVMTVGFSINGGLQEADVLEWLRDDPIRGIVVPKMVLTSGPHPHISFVQKHHESGSSIAMLLDPAKVYDMEQAARASVAIIAIASALYNSLYNRPRHREDYLNMMGIFYSRAWSTFSIKIQPGHYFSAQMEVFSMSLVLDDHPPMLLVFMPTRFELGNLPQFSAFVNVMAESAGRPYPIESALKMETTPQAGSMLVESFHYEQAKAHLENVAPAVYRSVGDILGHEFSIHDVFKMFGLVECPAVFARHVVNLCEKWQERDVQERAQAMVADYQRIHGTADSLDVLRAYVDGLQLENRKLENALRDRFAMMYSSNRYREREAERQKQKPLKHVEHQSFSREWRDTSQTNNTALAAMVAASMLPDDTPTHRCDPTPSVTESVCRDDSPSYSSCDTSTSSFD